MKAELMSVHFAQVNDKTKAVEDFVQSVVVGSNQTGIVVHFETTEKYVDVDVIHFGSQKIIYIIPSGLDDIDHRDYYEIHIQIKTDDISCAEMVTPLKHEYFVNLIPIDNLCDYDAI